MIEAGGWCARDLIRISYRTGKQDVRVSPYRLATHLTMAFVLIRAWCGAVWSSWEVKGHSAGLKHAAKLTPVARGAACLTLVTAISGAFVAGNDAGMAFNIWPYMIDDRDIDGEALFVPPIYLELQPLWRNMFENTGCVQFDHGCSPMRPVGAGLFALARSGAWHAIRLLQDASWRRELAVVGQASLGVATLLYVVPVELYAGAPGRRDRSADLCFGFGAWSARGRRRFLLLSSWRRLCQS